jgi:hypothetical protein
VGGSGGRRPADASAQHTSAGGSFMRRGVATAALGGAAGQLILNLARTPWGGRVVAGMVGGGAATAAWRWREDGEAAPQFETGEIPWVQQLAAQPGNREMLVPGQMLRKHPVGQLIAEDDHLVGCGAAAHTPPVDARTHARMHGMPVNGVCVCCCRGGRVARRRRSSSGQGWQQTHAEPHCTRGAAC